MQMLRQGSWPPTTTQPLCQLGLESSREDLLVLSSEPLESDMDVVGRVQITLRLGQT